MTDDSDFKHLVRERMARTGETYTAAHAALRPDATPHHPPVARPGADPDDTVAFTGDTGYAEGATGRAEHREQGGPSSMAAYLDVDPALSVDDLVMLGSLGITPDDLAGIRTEWPGCRLDDVVSLHTMGVTTDVIVAWQEVDRDPGVHDVLGAVSVGLTPQTFRGYLERFGGLTVNRALELYTVGITP